MSSWAKMEIVPFKNGDVQLAYWDPMNGHDVTIELRRDGTAVETDFYEDGKKKSTPIDNLALRMIELCDMIYKEAKQ